MSQLATPHVPLLPEPRTEIASQHPAGTPNIELISWKLDDFARPGSIYRNGETVMVRHTRPRWRVALAWALGPSFSLAATVREAVLTDQNLYVAFIDNRRIRAPRTSIWGRIELEPRLRGYDVFQIGPSFWIYLPPGTAELVAALDAFPLRKTLLKIPPLPWVK